MTKTIPTWYKGRYLYRKMKGRESASYQKSICKVNHELIHQFHPKGSNFDDLTQKDIFLMMNPLAPTKGNS